MLNKLFKRSGGFASPLPGHSGELFEINKWILSEFVVQKLVPVVGVHPYPLDEQMLMAAAVCRFRPALIFEWGTNIGKSARIFYEVSKAFGTGSEIHSIDLPDDAFHNEHPRSDRGILVRDIPGVHLHQADGLERSFEIISKQKKENNILFFVDGDHSYESVSRELSAILNRCPGAAVLLHDTFYQTEASGYNIGPFRAVQDVLSQQSHSYKTISTSLGLPGMTLVYR
jgi:cephalosporin hydroxylase